MELTITKERVLEAASQCNTAKDILRILFPEIFKSKFVISEAVSVIGESVYDNYKVQIDGNYVKVPLPNGNTAWTLDAFAYVERFCTKFKGAYPQHDVKNASNKFLYINCENLF